MLVLELEPVDPPPPTAPSVQIDGTALLGRLGATGAAHQRGLVDRHADRRRGAGPARHHRLRPGDGLPLRPRRPRQDHRRGARSAAGAAARPPLSGHRHSAARARAVPAQPRARAGRRALRALGAGAAPARRQGGRAGRRTGHVAVLPAQHVAAAPAVPEEHGRHGDAGGLAGARRRAVGPDRLPPLPAAQPVAMRCAPPASCWARPSPRASPRSRTTPVPRWRSRCGGWSSGWSRPPPPKATGGWRCSATRARCCSRWTPPAPCCSTTARC